jgi:hypothetical protein
MNAAKQFLLRVPIDVSQVADFTPGRRISVLAWNREGFQKQQLVAFEQKGTVTVTFELDRTPGSLQIALGPRDATAFELRHLQTASAALPASAWDAASEVELPAIVVTAWDWWWWQNWRQTFYVTGRVVDSYGYPIAGAAVSAFDVDAWWWWNAKEYVGSALTESDGSFVMGFTRGCGWSPQWWWSAHDWQVDAGLVEQITGFVRQYTGLSLMAPSSLPTFEVFQSLLTWGSRPLSSASAAALSQAGEAIDTTALKLMRQQLLKILPRQFSLPVWPWSERSPWDDCGANLIFRVTATEADRTVVLVNEGVLDTRWDIPRSLDVKLTAQETPLGAANGDWTLVDYLFPIPRGLQRESSAGLLV